MPPSETVTPKRLFVKLVKVAVFFLRMYCIVSSIIRTLANLRDYNTIVFGRACGNTKSIGAFCLNCSINRS